MSVLWLTPHHVLFVHCCVQGCAAKLTGAGGGGCAFAVLDERKDSEAQRLQLVCCCCCTFAPVF